MTYSFDEIIDRRETESIKWLLFEPDVLPMWVADMDFRSPEPVIRALRNRVEHGVFGYMKEMSELPELLVERMQRLYGWQVQPEEIVFLPGVVVGFNLAAHAMTEPGDAVLMQTPVYHPFFGIAKNVGIVQQTVDLTLRSDGSYEIDWDAFENGITDQTTMFLLCNPHNPIGRVFRKDELQRLAEICLRHCVKICSDEIHCDYIYRGHQHIPIASLGTEIARNTITLMAPSKTFNVAGLECAFAIIQNPELRDQFCQARQGLVSGPNMMGYIAATAAYREGQPWLDEMLDYMECNRDTLADFVNQKLPGVRMRKPEGTYLGWLDCREAGIVGKPGAFFLKNARVALNEGAIFGKSGEGFVRFNYGCPRSAMLEALERMKDALVNK